MTFDVAPAAARRNNVPIKLFALAMLIGVAGVLLVRGVALRDMVEPALAVIREAGPVAFFTAMAVLPTPLFWFTVPAGEAFAAQMTLPGVVAAALAAIAVNIALCHWLASRVLRPPLTAWLEKRGHRIPQMTPDNAVAVALLVRLTPGPPLCLQCYLLALAGMPFRLYMIVSWLITVPWVVGGVVMGRGILDGDVKLAAFGVCVLGTTIAAVKLMRRRLAGRPAARCAETPRP